MFTILRPACLLLLICFVVSPTVDAATEKEPRWDAEFDPERVQGKSENLSADVRAMWRVVPLEGEDFSVSPVSAILASERVFNAVTLEGLDRSEVAKVLRVDLRSDAYGYRAPFWPIPKNSEAYRFDCGNFGWQYTVVYGSDGKAKKVMRQWIH